MVLAFNDAINRADLAALAALMADDHLFIDSAGSVVEGRSSCLAAWSGFFDSFPDYRNRFELVEDLDGGRVRATGRSECSVEVLDGPAVWTALVADGLVVEWRVDDPT